MHVPLINFHRLYQSQSTALQTALEKCFREQHWILGPEVKQFEESCSSYLNVPYCVGTSSGTESLVLSLRALAIRNRGQEYFSSSDFIITTSFTFTATGDAILRSGATPLFVDIEPESFNINIQALEHVLAQQTGIIGIVPVHLFGQSCQMPKIMRLAEQFQLFVVEDVAQAMGAQSNSNQLGAIGTLGAFSFFPSKNLGCFGDAGLVATSDAELADIVRMLTKHGGVNKYDVKHIGYNARLDTMQAAILNVKLPMLDHWIEMRQKIAQTYSASFSNLGNITIPIDHGRGTHSFNQYTIRVPSAQRDALCRFLAEKGIGSAVYYPLPLHQMRVFDQRSKLARPLLESERASREVLSLPIDPLLTPEEQQFVIESVTEFVESI